MNTPVMKPYSLAHSDRLWQLCHRVVGDLDAGAGDFGSFRPSEKVDDVIY